jgi:hypothetical protein
MTEILVIDFVSFVISACSLLFLSQIIFFCHFLLGPNLEGSTTGSASLQLNTDEEGNKWQNRDDPESFFRLHFFVDSASL